MPRILEFFFFLIYLLAIKSTARKLSLYASLFLKVEAMFYPIELNVKLKTF